MKRLVLVLTLVTANVIFAQTATPPSGTGTSGDPFQIASLSNLYWIADQTNNNAVSFSGKYFLQTTNIDASVTTGWFPDDFGGYKGWDPIGRGFSDGSAYFSGSYDGHGHIISGIFIDRHNRADGVFGEISGASISSLGVTEANIKGGEGGGSNNAGGIAGFASGSSSIRNCFVTGSILGGQGVGGVVGQNEDGSTISNCYSRASVYAGDRWCGGLVGANNATIENCYSTGSVREGSAAGGLVGTNGGSATASFWDTETSGQSSSAVGIGKTTAEMKTQSTFTDAGWDFSTIWKMNGANYPELQVFSYTLTITSLNGTVAKNPDQASYNHGSAVILTATPATGYTFTGWSGDASGSTNPITVTMTGNKNITANYTINKYTIALTSANGTVEKNPDQASYDYGTTVTLTATPAPGYRFVNWTGNVTGSANPVSVSMDGNKTITANFAINTHTLTLSATNGSVAKNPDQASYNYGSEVILTATPATGYTFTGWSGDATGTTTPLTVTMNANKNITANFAVNTYSIAQAYSSVIQYVLSLPDNAFKKPADQRRSQLSDMFVQSQSKYNAGNSKAAAQYLSQNVTNHLTPQGKNSQNVWVTDETARLTLLSMLNDLLDLLQRPQLPGTQSANGSLAAMVEDIPTEYGLSQNYPNPFNPTTAISYQLSAVSFVRLVVYDALGREVATLVNGVESAGSHTVTWNALNVPSGIYVYRIVAGNHVDSKKMLLMK